MRTYGQIRYVREKRGEWHITTTPDVSMRLKRIFPRMDLASAHCIKLMDTPEVCNDLEWALVRFPMELDQDTSALLSSRAAAHRKKMDDLDKLLEAPRDASSFKLAFPPRDYQSIAASLYLANNSLLLADEVGLGKTVSAIATLTDKRTVPALIVVKAHLPKQWEREIKRFIPGAWVHIIKQIKFYQLPPADVYIISYSKLSAWWGHLAGKIRSVIYDEMQELRIPTSSKYEAAKLLNGTVDFRLGLSATPIHNYGGEVFNIINLLSPDALGTEEEFHREHCHLIYGKWAVKDPVALGAHLRSEKLMLRRTRKDVGRELPPQLKYVQDVEFDRNIYERGMSSADELAHTILTGTFEQRGIAARQFDLEVRQTTGLAKAPYVAELVRMLVDSGEKVLLAGWHRAVYAVWADRLRDLNPAFFTGHESDVQKDRAVRDFIEGRTNILVMSLRSGAGTDGLQHVCSCVVLGELDWTPAVHHQFIGRVERDGQKASVQVFIPVAPIGSDPTIASVLGLKEEQSIGIVDLGEADNPAIVEADPQRVKRLAMDYLRSRNIRIPQPVAE